MGDSIHRPPIVLQFDALEIIHHEIGFLEVAVVIVVEAIELVDLQTLDIGGITLLGLGVVVNQLQGIVAFHDTALVEHHRAQRGGAITMTIEDKGLRLLLTLALRPYLHLQLVLADRGHDVAVFIGREHLRPVLRRVGGILDTRHTNVERTVALSLIQSQHDILVVACLVNLVVETYGILW